VLWLPRRARIFCVVVTEAGSYLRLIDFCITQLKAQGPSRTCNESKEESRRRQLRSPQILGRGNVTIFLPVKALQLSQLASGQVDF